MIPSDRTAESRRSMFFFLSSGGGRVYVSHLVCFLLDLLLPLDWTFGSVPWLATRMIRLVYLFAAVVPFAGAGSVQELEREFS
jgi:hypothetical protein